MIRIFRHFIHIGTIVEALADATLCIVLVIIAVNYQGARLHAINGSVSVVWVAIALAALMTTLLACFGIYGRTQPMRFTVLLSRTLVALLLGSIVAYVFGTLISADDESRKLLAVALLFLTTGLLLTRPALLSSRHAGVGVRRLLVIGAGADARDINSELALIAAPSFVVVGFVPVDNNVKIEVDPSRLLPHTVPLHELVARMRIDEVLVAVREKRGGGLPIDALLECRVRGIPITDLSGFYERVRSEVSIDHLKASWFVYGQGFTQNAARTFIKRVFDVSFSITMIVLALPIMLLAAIAIRLESPGPVIFRQERTGLGGLPFICLKFRSMRIDAEKDGVARWASIGDSRITRTGVFLRKTRIDELPQLINVLRGEMSLVGPRPERPQFVSTLKTSIPFYAIRHTVKPGVTGWAQVRFTYGSTVEESRRKLQFDLYYVKNHSLFLDMLIIFETVRVVIFREGAR